MEEQYFLYTVTGLREPFYAAVDHDTGRAWTSPTKDGAIRQGREAGIENFLERTITREKFLRSLGIENDPQPRIHHDTTHIEPAKKPASPAPWFTVDANAVDDDSNGKAVSFPPRLKSNRKSAAPKGGSPFAASQISTPSGR